MATENTENTDRKMNENCFVAAPALHSRSGLHVLYSQLFSVFSVANSAP